jgi:hypothetical protein
MSVMHFDGLYGNQPNMADGSLGGPSDQAPGTKGRNVLPSQSPDPSPTTPVTRATQLAVVRSRLSALDLAFRRPAAPFRANLLMQRWGGPWLSHLFLGLPAPDTPI